MDPPHNWVAASATAAAAAADAVAAIAREETARMCIAAVVPSLMRCDAALRHPVLTV